MAKVRPAETRLKVLTVFGTRPEAIKMAPVVRGLAADPKHFESVVCVTAQHRQMLDQVLTLFDIHPDIDLDIMRPNQDLFQITTTVLTEMRQVLEKEKPDIVLVQGDTTTTMATALACYYLKIPVGHIEAGLRTYNAQYPFPEEMNRVLTDTVATLFFPPTEESKENLIRLGAPPECIHMTGNTVIDALFYTLEQTREAPLPLTLDPSKRLVLVTAHRRENFGAPMEAMCRAIQRLVDQHMDIEVVIPVHPNPNAHNVIYRHLKGRERIHLIEPQDYAPFCRLMEKATLILTDSGGVQEEAPSLGKPVLVLREETERPEAVALGTVKLVGQNEETILTEASRLLSDPAAYAAMAHAVNPYGDGHATERILAALKQFLSLRGRIEATDVAIS